MGLKAREYFKRYLNQEVQLGMREKIVIESPKSIEDRT